jgi:hypothetical protein
LTGRDAALFQLRTARRAIPTAETPSYLFGRDIALRCPRPNPKIHQPALYMIKSDEINAFVIFERIADGAAPSLPLLSACNAFAMAGTSHLAIRPEFSRW